MARLMLSAGMFSPLAAKIAVRKRGLESGSPPPWRAAMVISLIRRVKIFPRLASSAPFLCLIVAHLEWPDMGTSESVLVWNFAVRGGKKAAQEANDPQLPAIPKYSKVKMLRSWHRALPRALNLGDYLQVR